MNSRTERETTWSTWIARASVPRNLRALSLYRIIVGVVLLYQQLINYHQRLHIWGPEGVWPHAQFIANLDSSSFSLYAVSSSVWWFELVYHLGIIATLLWTVGARTRVMTPVVYALHWSLHVRLGGIWDGGDNLTQILLLYAIFADVGAYWSVDSWTSQRHRTPGPHGAAAIVHNAAVVAICAQVSIVYFVAGLWKVHGDTWFWGTALYYAMRAPEFALPGYSERIYENAVLVTLLTQATIAFQIAFPFCVWMGRRSRVLLLVVALGFHVGIAIFMGLPTFACLMIAADLALVSDSELESIAAQMRRAIRRTRTRVATRGRSKSDEVAVV